MGSLGSLRAVSLLALVVAAGCSNTPTASTTLAPTVSPSTAASAAATVNSSNGHDAPDLEALLPSQFEKVTMERDSLVGSNALGADSSSSVITKFLTDNGRTLPDFAVAQASDPSGQVDIEIVAFRVKGADPTVLQAAILGATQAADPELAITQVTVKGHQITRGDSGGRIRYLYTSSGVVFGVSSGTQSIVDDAVAALP